MTGTKTILARILFALYLAAIALLCFMNVDKLPQIQKEILGFPTDKIAHFIMFLPFPILAYLAYDHVTNKVWSCFLFALLAMVAGTAVAFLTEYVQGMLSYRTRDLFDFKADLLALGISTLFVFIVDISNLKNRNKQQ